MKHFLSITFSMFALWGLLALTPAEKSSVSKALSKVTQAQAEYARAKAETATAWEYAGNADARAAETDAKIGPLQEQINASHENEQRLGNLVAKYQPFYILGHKFWGVGGIIQGFGILATHLLILIAFLALLVLGIWALSLVFPVFGPIFAIISSFAKRVWASVARRK